MTYSFRQGCRVDDRVVVAAANNAAWCDLICRLHGIPTSLESAFWVAQRRSPEFYPDAVTLLPHAAAEEVLRRCDGGRGCSVKDSFGTLDLARWGFDELFQAQWIFRDAGMSSARSSTPWSASRRKRTSPLGLLPTDHSTHFAQGYCATRLFECWSPTGRSDSLRERSLTGPHSVWGYPMSSRPALLPLRRGPASSTYSPTAFLLSRSWVTSATRALRLRGSAASPR